MDVKIKTETAVFNYCARAMIEQDGKVLIMCVDDAGYYHLPGGHVAIGETSEQALVREIAEEVGFTVTVKKLVLVGEQFYQKKGIDNHSVIFYYLAQPQAPVSTQNSVRMEPGQTKMHRNELRWVTRAELKSIDLRPASVKDLILQDKFDTLRHIVG